MNGWILFEMVFGMIVEVRVLKGCGIWLVLSLGLVICLVCDFGGDW